MGKRGRDGARQRGGGKGYERYGARGGGDDRWDPGDRRKDPGRDVSDLYEDVQGQAGDDLLWPEFDEEYED